VGKDCKEGGGKEKGVSLILRGCGFIGSGFKTLDHT
jgi:hypothetical protein